ncbi:MAG: hypothetical protein QGG25_13205, partial [Phycisphaerae bacterium]|nr:hypothetical protein [Phycisphaerae bacterium]
MTSKLSTAVIVSILLSAACGPLIAAERSGQLDRIINDWMIQDHGKDTGKCFTATAGCDIEARMVTKALTETPVAELKARFDALVKDKVAGKDPRWKKLY